MNKIIFQKISKAKNLPTKKLFQKWVNTVLANRNTNHEVVIRLTGTKESTQLNKKYRKKNEPTNIISFPFEAPPGIKSNFLGDLVICVPLVIKEAKLQHKTVLAHFAHLTIHGILHLMGHTHKKIQSAKKMETLEIKYLKKLGFSNPYLY